jgi:spermidine synthase
VLLLTPGGAHEVANALAHGAGQITAVELQPGVAALARQFDPGEVLEGASAPVTWAIGDARRFLAHTPQRYDLVTSVPLRAAGPAPARCRCGGLPPHRRGYLRCLEVLHQAGCWR